MLSKIKAIIVTAICFFIIGGITFSFYNKKQEIKNLKEIQKKELEIERIRRELLNEKYRTKQKYNAKAGSALAGNINDLLQEHNNKN